MGNVADELRHPVGQLPPEVYWRRRVVIIAGGLLAVIVLYYLIRGLFAGGGEAEPTPLVTLSPSPTVSASLAVAADASNCTGGGIAVTLEAVPFTTSAGSEPYFEVGITNTGVSDCTLDLTVGGDELLIESKNEDGWERYWSNLDCAPEAPLFDDAPRLIEPGEEALVAVTWPVERSTESCASGLTTPPRGDAYYWATLTVLDVVAEPTQFEVD